MISGKKILGLICARGGSKRLPGKNLKLAKGMPLIAWTIDSAKKSKYIDRLILSSDDSEIIAVASKWGCDAPFVRNPRLAKDDTPGIEPVLDAIERLPGYDYVVLLQPTSPLRSVVDIDEAIEMCVNNSSPSCVSVVGISKKPDWFYRVSSDNAISPLSNDGSEVCMLNGAVYVADCAALIKSKSFVTNNTLAYKMPLCRSVDIDDENDWARFVSTIGEVV